MNQEKCNAIEAYLSDNFPGSQIEQANISDDQHYQIHTENGSLMLIAGRNFIDDNSQDEIINKLKSWNVPNMLKEDRKLGILVTDAGANTYQRS